MYNRQPKGNFHCNLWTRYSRPECFHKGWQLLCAILGPLLTSATMDENRQPKETFIAYLIVQTNSRPEYFHNGWKIPYYTGRLRNRCRSEVKSATKGYSHCTHVYAVSRPEYFHKGWKMPYHKGRLRNRPTIVENRQRKGIFIVLIGRDFTSRVLS